MTFHGLGVPAEARLVQPYPVVWTDVRLFSPPETEKASSGGPCGACGREACKCGQIGGRCCGQRVRVVHDSSTELSTRSAGCMLARRARPQIHRVLPVCNVVTQRARPAVTLSIIPPCLGIVRSAPPRLHRIAMVSSRPPAWPDPPDEPTSRVREAWIRAERCSLTAHVTHGAKLLSGSEPDRRSASRP